MAYQFSIMTQAQAETIAYDWHYPGEYSFYNIESDQEDMEEFLDPEKRGDSMLAVTAEGELIGFFSAAEKEQGVYEIGLGMRPDLTGRGSGRSFLAACMTILQEKKAPGVIALSVALFNVRAIKVYRSCGFRDGEQFNQSTNGGSYPFLKMYYHCGS
ncbi:GNAT family N-acetyltransferase [Peribacillus sp. SCS-26]|uniref:GNAT family N-acetyltransferase n=1 Tax=Paraperibacillus marinus TaxID=3115295 RepID=UPI003906362A